MVQSLSAANGARLTYCYLSDLIGKKIYGRDYGLIGKVVDVVATHDDRQPQVRGLLLAKGHWKQYFPAAGIDLLGLARSTRFILTEEPSPTSPPDENHFLVRGTPLRQADCGHKRRQGGTG